MYLPLSCVIARHIWKLMSDINYLCTSISGITHYQHDQTNMMLYHNNSEKTSRRYGTTSSKRYSDIMQEERYGS